MTQTTYRTPTGVLISRDFRDNLIIDRFDPVFADMRASKLKHMRSANSEDALTWNVFRSLRQVDPRYWLPDLWHEAFPATPAPRDGRIVVKLWESVRPPLSLLEAGDEGASEIDVVIEAPTWVWFLEAKFRSDISRGTTTRPDRDQVIRNLDVGTWYAGVRPFYFSLLTLKSQGTTGSEVLGRYSDHEVVKTLLRDHRPDGLGNLAGVGALTWRSMASVLARCTTTSRREEEQAYAARALKWLEGKGIVP